MIILDTDHFTIVQYADDSRYPILRQRLVDSPDQWIATTVVTAEEQLRGWLAEVNRWRDVRRQMPAYERLMDVVEDLNDWEVLRLDESAAKQVDHLRSLRLHIGTQDLKIAAITLAHDALLLSANARDFRRVPGIKVESWIE